MGRAQEYADVFTSSDDYAKRFSGEIGQWLIYRQTRILEGFLSNLAPKTILDVAGGHGQIANSFHDRYKIKVLGSSEQCNKQINSEAEKHGCEFESGDIETLNYPDASFDVVTCIRYISHTENWKAVIKELCRVASKAVIIDFPPLVSFNILNPILFKLKKKVEGNTRTFTVFSKSEINNEFLANGYKLEGCKGEFFFPMVLHRALDNPSISSCLEFIPDVLALTDILGSPAISAFLKVSGV